MASLRKYLDGSTDTARLDQPTASAGVPGYMAPAELPQQPAAQPVAPDPRWSTGLERMPGWLEGQDQQTTDFYQKLYDNPKLDAGSQIADLETNYRNAREGAGLKTDATSANILPFLDDFALSGDFRQGDGQGGEQASQQASQPSPNQSDIMSELRGFFSGGQPNQDILNRRTEGARENLERFRKSQNSQNRAMLANRGLIGDGPEMTAQNRVESDIADKYSGAVSQIYADEYGRSDDRMMEALRLAAGLETSGQDRDLTRTLGLGNLALGNSRAENDYSLGLGNLELGQNRLGWDVQEGGTNQLIQILQLMLQGAGQSAEGYVR